MSLYWNTLRFNSKLGPYRFLVIIKMIGTDGEGLNTSWQRDLLYMNTHSALISKYKCVQSSWNPCLLSKPLLSTKYTCFPDVSNNYSLLHLPLSDMGKCEKYDHYNHNMQSTQLLITPWHSISLSGKTLKFQLLIFKSLMTKLKIFIQKIKFLLQDLDSFRLGKNFV